MEQEPLTRFLADLSPDSPPKEAPPPLTLGSRNAVLAPDVSGSTRGYIESKIREVVKEVGQQSKGESYIAPWDTRAGAITHAKRPFNSTSFDYHASFGGTYPAVLLSNSDFRSIVRDPKNFFLFITDGEIGQAEVEQSSRYVSIAAHIPVICLLVANSFTPIVAVAGAEEEEDQSAPPVSADLSVFAPFLATCPHLAVVAMSSQQTGADLCYLLHAQGVFTSLQGRTASLTALLDVSCPVEECQDRGDDDRVVTISQEGQASESIRLSLNKVTAANELSMAEVLCLKPEGLEKLALASMTNGRQASFRKVLNETRDRLATAIQEAMTDPREMECQEIISKILELQRSTVEDKDARLKREMELTSLRERLRILRHEVNEVIARKRSQETPYHEPQRIVLQALDFLTTLEKGGYRQDVLCNRAKRAVQVNVAQAASRELDTQGACTGTCMVCLESDQPLALLLRQLGTPEVNTDDFAANYPLAMGSHEANANLLCPAVLCSDCIKHLTRCPLTREPVNVLALQALRLHSSNNMSHLKEVVAFATTRSALMANLPMMFFSCLVHHYTTYEWAQQRDMGKLLTFFMQEILKHALSTTSLSNEGDTVSLEKALVAVISQSVYFNRQPVRSNVVIVWSLLHFNLGVPVNVISRAMHVRLLWATIEQVLREAKDNILDTTKHLKSLLFKKLRYGVPIRGSEKCPTIEEVLPQLAPLLQNLQTRLTEAAKTEANNVSRPSTRGDDDVIVEPRHSPDSSPTHRHDYMEELDEVPGASQEIPEEMVLQALHETKQDDHEAVAYAWTDEEAKTLLETYEVTVAPPPPALGWVLATLLQYEENKRYPLRGFRVESCVEQLLKETNGPFALQMPSLVREARVLRFIHNQIDFGVLDDIHDGCPPFAEHCFWPSVRQCICGEVFDDDTTLPITDRALNIHAKRRVHFQKVYHSIFTAPFSQLDKRSLHTNTYLELVKAAIDVGKSVCEKAAGGDQEAAQSLLDRALQFLVQGDRGDTFNPNLERYLTTILPSFLQRVKELGYDAIPYDTTQQRLPSLETKLRWELGEPGKPLA